MNIKKIIKEEIDDFGWMEQANYISYDYLKGKALEFDPIIDDEDYFNKVIGVLNDLGFESDISWDILSVDEYDDEGIVGLYMDNNSVIWTGNIFEGYKEHIEDYADKSIEVLNGRSLFPDNINESEFEWAEDIPDVDIYKPQVGYVYRWEDYKHLLRRNDGGMGNDGPTSDEIVIKNIETVSARDGGHYTIYEFDTVNNYWGLSHLDGIDSRDFVRKVKDGTITFIGEL